MRTSVPACSATALALDAERADLSRRRHARLRGHARRPRPRARCAAAPPRVNLDEGASGGGRSLRNSGVKAAQQLIDYATKHYSSTDSKDVKLLRRRLIQAGIYDPRARRSISSLRALVLAVGGAVAVVLRAADARHARQKLVLAVRHGGRPARLSDAEPLSRPAGQGEEGRAPGRLPRPHGSPGGLRRRRPRHGGFARPRRPRARRVLSVARRQHPHGERSKFAPAARSARRSTTSATGSASTRRARSPP